MKISYKNIIKSPESLVTTYEATRAGFVSLALEKNKKATPMVQEAKALKVNISFAKSPIDLLKKKEIYQSLLTASGLSDKAITHLTDKDKKYSIQNLIKNFLEPAGDSFIDELIYRFLLTKGDTLGGIMRNLAGYLGEVKLTRALISNLNIRGYDYYWLNSKTKTWAKKHVDDSEIEYNTNRLYWYNKEKRTLLYNLILPLVKNNIDLILVNGDARNINIKEINNKDFIALGELKGGIDPAGADEHWKTANSALNRIRTAFKNISLNPKTFFIGAAIEKNMAIEIFHQLETGNLNFAGNLTNDKQLFSLCKWLIEL